MAIFIVYRIWAYNSFLLIIKILFHCLLASMVSHEKCAVSDTAVLVLMKCNWSFCLTSARAFGITPRMALPETSSNCLLWPSLAQTLPLPLTEGKICLDSLYHHWNACVKISRDLKELWDASPFLLLGSLDVLLCYVPQSEVLFYSGL